MSNEHSVPTQVVLYQAADGKVTVNVLFAPPVLFAEGEG